MNFNDTVHKMRVERNGTAYVAEKPKKIKKSKIEKHTDDISKLQDVIRALANLSGNATDILDDCANHDGLNGYDVHKRIISWCKDTIEEYNDKLDEEKEYGL